MLLLLVRREGVDGNGIPSLHPPPSVLHLLISASDCRLERRREIL